MTRTAQLFTCVVFGFGLLNVISEPARCEGRAFPVSTERCASGLSKNCFVPYDNLHPQPLAWRLSWRWRDAGNVLSRSCASVDVLEPHRWRIGRAQDLAGPARHNTWGQPRWLRQRSSVRRDVEGVVSANVLRWCLARVSNNPLQSEPAIEGDRVSQAHAINKQVRALPRPHRLFSRSPESIGQESVHDGREEDRYLNRIREAQSSRSSAPPSARSFYAAVEAISGILFVFAAWVCVEGLGYQRGYLLFILGVLLFAHGFNRWLDTRNYEPVSSSCSDQTWSVSPASIAGVTRSD